MKARMVLYATIHDPRNGAWHREDPRAYGIPACGVPLRRPHRAFAVTDGPYCATCWGELAVTA